MKDLTKMVLVFIYPDGEIEREPITDSIYHIDYMIERRSKSQRFARVTKNATFKNPTYQDIIRELLNNGVITLLNYNVVDIVKNPEFLEQSLPNFLVYLPTSFGSVEQIMTYQKIMGNYPTENMICGTMDKDTGEIIDLVGKDYDDFIEAASMDFLELVL